MPVNRQTVRELSRTTLYNITSSGQAWRAFLDAAARLYKYSFPEQVLIYAQEPEATACAAKEVWYTRMKRSLRPDAQAIALPDPHSHFGRLKYVFDVRETQPLPGAPEFRQWSLPFEALERVTDRLGQEYGISRDPVVADRVYALVMNAPQELYPMQLTAMLRAADAEGRWSGRDDAALARQFHQLVADSAAYMAGVRVGVGAGAVTADALESITRFNSPGLAALAGAYASRLAASVLRDIERAARENGRLAIPARGVQNEGREEFSHAAEAAKEVKDNDIHDTERRALSGPDAGRTGGSTGQIRPAAPPTPGEKRPRPAEQPAAGGRAEQSSGADRPSGARAGGADDGASGTAHKAAGQTDGPAWLGRDDEQPAPAGGGNGDGADLRQLSLFPAEEEIQETGRSGTERPVSLSPDEIDDILRCDREYKKGCKKEDIEAFFSTTMDMQERKAFLADAMGHTYTELFIGNHRYGYCNRGNGTVEFWRGGYLSARAKTTLTLLEAAERAAQLIEQGTYRREAPPAAFPIVEDAREEHADGTAAQAGFSEDEINAVLCHGSGFSKGKFRIAEWYEGRHTEKETADFLKHEYGVGGMTWTFPDGTHGSVDYNMYGRPGISVIRGTGMDAPYQLLKWPEAARRIGQLVENGLYLTGEGQPEPVKLCRAAEALPRGGVIEIEGREHSITEVNFKSRTVILKDMEPAPGQPRYTTMDVPSAYDAFQEDGQRMAELPQAAQVQKDTPPVPKLDYRYPTEDASPGGPKARFALNAAAIETLRRIEDEGRLATAEEQGILARYVGWGGLADAFDGEKNEWAQEYAQLKSLLDESEYMAARASTLTAFYTPPTVIRAMYGALERWGVTGGNLLEPSMGVGAFFGCRPEQFDTNPTGLYGVELDRISARIAKQLYQSAHIYSCGYEKTALPDSFFDCAVGNVPFGSFGVHDARYDREHWLIHDYFFGKTIDKVRVGGIIAFITSSGTLDKASGNVRRYIAQRCELIGAVRLPSDTFRQSAGTEVTSDILFLQKRERMADRDEAWLHVGKTGDGVPINQYFAEHPEMVLGDMVMENGPFGPRSVCRPRPGQDLGAALRAALGGLDARLPAALPLEQAEQEIEVLPADPDVRNYSFTEVDGRLYFRENSVMRAVKLDGANTRRVRELIALRSQARRLMQVQLDGCGDAAVQLEQDRLNRLYDNFVRRYGRINSRGNAGVFRDDSGYFLLCALEVFDDEGNFKCKSDMFTKLCSFGGCKFLPEPEHLLHRGIDLAALLIRQKRIDEPLVQRQ
ncbi:N-6 DNA methylase, partial [Ruthenibacterium lactatiformans]